MKKTPSLWIVTEGLAGTENQCLGVAECLQDYYPDLQPHVMQIALREPWKKFSPFLGFEQWWSFDPILVPPWPDILITSGRKAIAASRFVKKVSEEKSFTLHIQDPRIKSDAFDLVAVPEHDSLRGENVLVTAAAPNRVTPKRLERAQSKFMQYDLLKSPRVAVLIGGDSKTHKMTRKIAKRMITDLEKIADQASLMITVSRRTPDFVLEKLKKAFPKPRHTIYDGGGENPYFALLAYADFIIATNDSASMISEAATTGKPVYMVPLKGESAKFERFYSALKERGILRDFGGALEKWSYSPLNDAKAVAAALHERYEEHAQRLETQTNKDIL